MKPVTAPQWTMWRPNSLDVVAVYQVLTKPDQILNFLKYYSYRKDQFLLSLFAKSNEVLI